MQAQFKNIGKLILCLALCLIVGFIGSIFAQISIQDWYPGLNHPMGTPPSGAFAPIWTLFYVMMGVSLWWAGFANPSKEAYALFYLQLFFNLIWSFVFFGMRSILLGFIDILLLDICLAATIWTFWPFSRPAALLLIPYFVWTVYATFLNFGLLVLNR